MTNSTGSYDKQSLIDALRAVGVKRGDIIFSHVGLGFLGYPKEGADKDTACRVIVDAMTEVLGPEGTWIVPTYSYSFCEGQDYDAATSPSTIGYFTEVFRKLPGVIRSREPNFSVAGFGPHIEALFKNLPMDSFGKDCIYDRLVHAGASLCNIGVGFRYATFVHHVEQSASVPYRFHKLFKGNIIENGGKTPEVIDYYVRTGVDDLDSWPNLTRLEEDARRSGILNEAPLGKSVVSRTSCKDFFDLATACIKKNPWYLADGYEKHTQ